MDADFYPEGWSAFEDMGGDGKGDAGCRGSFRFDRRNDCPQCDRARRALT